LQAVADVARWSEQAGCRGILVYTDNGLVDPWLVSQVILASTDALCPLVAVQPVYMHPYSVAKMVTSLGFLHHRRVYLNMVAGGFKNDLVALNDETPHDERYDRTVEYTTIIKRLLTGGAPTSFEGKYYTVRNLSLQPPLPAELYPGLMISGSSPAGLAAAEAIGATAVRYPAPPGEEAGVAATDAGIGIRVGVIARESGDEAWRVALERFPEDRKGQITHKLAMRVSDSQWHRQLSELGTAGGDERPTYWLGPFENYKTFCPYLVGSYEQVTRELSRYLDLGFRTFILDIPPSREELEHIGVVFQAAAGDSVR
jgi:alkanesulfonate monooxygenase